MKTKYKHLCVDLPQEDYETLKEVIDEENKYLDMLMLNMEEKNEECFDKYGVKFESVGDLLIKIVQVLASHSLLLNSIYQSSKVLKEKQT